MPLETALKKNGLGRFLDLILFTPPTSNGLELGLERYWWEHEIPPTLILSNVSQPEILKANSASFKSLAAHHWKEQLLLEKHTSW
jgi:hypothetical protein